MWVIARTLAAVLCMAGVAATYAAARRLWGVREGLVAAAVLAFAFLPVAYSRVAVTDVGSLLGVALALLWSVRAAEEGRTRWFVLAGAAAGLAIALQVHGRARAAAARDRGDRAAARGRPAAGRRPGRRRRRGGGRVRAAQPVPVRFVRRLVARPARPGRRRRQRPQAGPGVGRLLLLPRQPHLGARLGGDRRGLGRRGAGAAATTGARADPGRAAARPVRLPGVPVALLRALAAARLPGAGDARRGRRGAGGGGGAAALAGGRDGGARAGGRRPAARRGRAHRARARPRGHAQRGSRLPRRDLPARPARVDRARRARPLLPLEPRGHDPLMADALPAAPRVDRAGLVLPGGRRPARVRPATSRACSCAPTGACGPRPTTSCSARA